MSNFVLIITLIQFYGPAITSVPFATAEACLDARDDQRKSSSKHADCYATGIDAAKRGRIER
jgi:hypothetical protein